MGSFRLIQEHADFFLEAAGKDEDVYFDKGTSTDYEMVKRIKQKIESSDEERIPIEEKVKISLLRMICCSCEAMLLEPEKWSIFRRMSKGISAKSMCTKCVQKANKKFFEKYGEELKKKRAELRDIVYEDKLNYKCETCTGCLTKNKIIFHKKRNKEVAAAAVTLKDYNENCQIICKMDIEIKIKTK
jgi:hypothetical protein